MPTLRYFQFLLGTNMTQTSGNLLDKFECTFVKSGGQRGSWQLWLITELFRKDHGTMD